MSAVLDKRIVHDARRLLNAGLQARQLIFLAEAGSMAATLALATLRTEAVTEITRTLAIAWIDLRSAKIRSVVRPP